MNLSLRPGLWSILLLGLLALSACKPRVIPAATARTEAVSVVQPPLPPDAPAEPEAYQGPRERAWDLLHTTLRVNFDWDQRRLNGQADLRMVPLFYDQTQVDLDARGFEIASVQLGGQALAYQYGLRTLSVQLPRTFSRRDTLTLSIRYTARPHEFKALGIEEKADDHGLYFIHHRSTDPNRPRQIWTQGETESNSCWFPTFDQPNERCTQEMFIQVQDSFVTLSNGLLVGSEAGPNNTRIDHWKMNQPHAPYLFMMAVGEFSVVKDTWRGRPVDYYVEPKYEPYARQIFGNTPEMLEFFSERIGYEFPWDKYSQVVVRQFVSGAMENTSATIHFDGLQRTDRELLDATLEEFISHELFHQWFGDVVTCESWAQLTLNEGFATYGEYLWIEHKYGAEEANWHFQGDRRAYLGQAEYEQHPLIDFAYEDPDDMFDAHSYQKGGQVLHMLRQFLGDEAFFASISHYLHAHAFSAVEVDELRLAFEDVTGLNLKWFFDQWYLSSGHPELEVVHRYENDRYLLDIVQTQTSPLPSTFRFLIQINGETASGEPFSQFHEVDRRDTTLLIRSGPRPRWVGFNADGALLAEVRETKALSDWRAQFRGASFGYQRAEALRQVSEEELDRDNLEIMREALEDDFWGISRRALGYLRTKGSDAHITALREELLALLNAPEATLRSVTLDLLTGRAEYIREAWSQEWQSALLTQVRRLTTDRSPLTQLNAVSLLHALVPGEGLTKARALAPTAEGNLVQAVARIFALENAPETVEFVGQQLDRASSSRQRSGLVNALGKLWEQYQSTAGETLLRQVGSDDSVWWVRLTALRNLGQYPMTDDRRAFFQSRQAVETNNLIRDLLDQLLEMEETGSEE